MRTWRLFWLAALCLPAVGCADATAPADDLLVEARALTHTVWLTPKAPEAALHVQVDVDATVVEAYAIALAAGTPVPAWDPGALQADGSIRPTAAGLGPEAYGLATPPYPSLPVVGLVSLEATAPGLPDAAGLRVSVAPDPSGGGARFAFDSCVGPGGQTVLIDALAACEGEQADCSRGLWLWISPAAEDLAEALEVEVEVSTELVVPGQVEGSLAVFVE